MKRIPPIKITTAVDTRQSSSHKHRREFPKALILARFLLTAFIVLTGGLLYGEGSDDALFIDEKGTVKIQELEVTENARLGAGVTVGGATTLNNNLTVNGNVGIGTTSPTAALEVKTGRIKDKTGFVMPVGTILPYGGKQVPIGWLECNGYPVSRKTHADLFRAIGTLWGGGDGKETFNLPDLRGQFLRGQDHGANVDPDRNLRKGKPGGSNKDEVGSYQEDEIKTHTLRFNFTGVRYVNNAFGKGSAPNKNFIQGAQDDSGRHLPNKKFEIQSFGNSKETRPKNAYVMFIIKY